MRAEHRKNVHDSACITHNLINVTALFSIVNNINHLFSINTMPTTQDALWKRVDASLDTIRPHLKIDGGNIKIVEITEDKVVKVKLLGACETCPISFVTMKAGVEQSIKMAIPEITKVVAVD